MEIVKCDKVLRFDGEIKFQLKELGKLYKSHKDIGIMAVDWLFKKNNVPNGIYLLTETSFDYEGKAFKGQWIISYDTSRRTRVKFHHAETFGKEILELCK